MDAALKGRDCRVHPGFIPPFQGSHLSPLNPGLRSFLADPGLLHCRAFSPSLVPLYSHSKCRRRLDDNWQGRTCLPRSGMAKANPVKWTREHFLIALNLYCKLPFGKLDQRNPIIKEVSAKMGRTPSSLAMKLSNFDHVGRRVPSDIEQAVEDVLSADRARTKLRAV